MPTRTLTQNAALHQYCEMVASALNEAGLDMQTVLAEGTEIPWSGHNVKEHIWRTVQRAALGKESTTELSTVEVSEMYDVINRQLSQAFGVVVPWPERDM